MKKIKSVFWILIVGFILIAFFSNLDFFLQSQQIKLNFIIKNYPLPELPNAILFLMFFTAGLLIAYVSNLPERFRLRKTIKGLRAAVDSQEKTLATLRTYPIPAPADSATEGPESGGGSR